MLQGQHSGTMLGVVDMWDVEFDMMGVPGVGCRNDILEAKLRPQPSHKPRRLKSSINN